MKKPVLFVCLGIFAFLVAGYLGFSLYNPNSANEVNQAPLSVSQADTALNRDSDPDDNISATDDPALPNSQALRLLGTDIDADASSPTQCFIFNAEFSSAERVALSDLYTVSPQTPTTLSVSGNRLCLSGFDFTTSYSVTWRAGLEAQNGARLGADVNRDISFGDKPPFVGFAGQGIILPRLNAQGLGIETVNVSSLDVTIFRVSDRIMARRAAVAGDATLEGNYSWEGQNAAKDVRSEIWSGTIAVKSVPNEKVTTVLPLAAYIGTTDPGAYVVRATRSHDTGERNVASAWRWIVSTDLAMTSYRGDEGLTVSVRSIDSAKLQPDTAVKLMAYNNDVLADAVTDRTGRVTFAQSLLRGQGALRPKMLMAYGAAGDYAVLDLSRAPLDLSRYAIDGRAVAKPVDVFAYSERGIYRPGETMIFSALLRDTDGRAFDDRPITLKIKRPNGIIMATQRFDTDALAKHGAGLVYRYDIPSSAARGQWSAEIEADGMGRLSTTRFAVQDFVPQKIKLDIKTGDTPIADGETRTVTLDAQFLYGAPGANLPGEANARLRVDPKPFPDYADYQFGSQPDDFRERLLDLGGGVTDASGTLDLELDISGLDIDTSYALRADITAGTSEPGGRYTRDSVRVPVRLGQHYMGIKSATGQARFAKGRPAVFDLVALDRLGARIDLSAKYSLVEEDWDYQWYRQGGRWRYRRDVIDVPVQSGLLTVSKVAPTTLSKRLGWGSYRLDVTSDNGTKTSYRFSVGWGSGETSDVPDQIKMSGPTTAVKPGEDFTLDINAPYGGKAELVIANNAVRVIRALELPEGGTQITLPFDPNWGESVYAMLSVYTPRDVTDRPIPRRAVGITYIERDRSDQILDVTIQTPDLIRPRQTHSVTIDVDNIPRGERAYATIAAVDEGILLLTKYKSPEAAKTLLGKKAFGLEVFDDYARLLNPNLGAPTLANSGGDSLGGEGLTVVPTRTLSLFDGPISLKNGKATIPFDIPDFNGELRLMVTAWSGSAVGSASTSVTVRDTVPAITALPRFLAPGDEAFATVSLDNVEGAAGRYKAALMGSDVVTAGSDVTLNLEQGERKEDRIALSANQIGVTELSASISGASNYSATTTYPIQVRTPFFPLSHTQDFVIAPGETQTLTADMLSGDFVPGSVDVTASISSVAGLTPAPYVASLSRYPYGCTEQTIATALPLLYVDQLGGFKSSVDQDYVRNVQKSVARIVNRQDAQGVFGLWREGDGAARAWLGAHTTFFLQEAAAKGYAVPDDVLSRAYTALAEIARMSRYPNVNYQFGSDRYDRGNNKREKAEAAAYAHYVLARAGKGRLPDMRYHLDYHAEAMKTPVSFAYLGAALSMLGDDRRAERAFTKGLEARGFETGVDYYQSQLRDNGGFIAAAKSVDADSFVTQMLPQFADQLDEPSSLNTQEKAYVILAMQAVIDGQTQPKISAKGVTFTEAGTSLTANLYDTTLSSGVTITNEGDAPAYLSLSYSGAPQSAPVAGGSGFEVSKRYYNMDGKQRDITTMKQGERAIVRIDFNSTQRRSRMAVIADLLPAGVEIETILSPSDGVVSQYGETKRGAYAFLGELSDFDITEARDDRFIASRETYRQTEYRVAYIIRAVTPGNFIAPGVVVQDMYRNNDSAVTDAMRIRVTTDNAL